MGNAHWIASGLPLTVEHLKEIVDYDPNSGLFTWKIRIGPRAKIGQTAGTVSGRAKTRMMCVDGNDVSSPRLAWFYVYGKWPIGVIAHINGDTLDDRIDNLVDVGAAKIVDDRVKITVERLREIARYDPVDGHFYWLPRPSRLSGRSVAGARLAETTNSNGYYRVCVDRRHYMLHRVAWLYMTGEWPRGDLVIDHINCVKTDNRWENLRIATRMQNARNNSGRRNRKSPYKGVSQQPNGRWKASINVTLGVFDTPEEARDAWLAAAKVYHGEFARS